MPHPPVRAAGVAPPASICLGAKTALVRCQAAQGPHPRVRFSARRAGGGAGMVLGSSSARNEYVRLLLLWIADFCFLTSKAGFQLLVLPL